MLGGLGLRLLLGEVRPDLLGGVGERGIVGLDLDLRDDGGDVTPAPMLVQLGAESLLQVVADVALRHGPALGKVHDGNRGIVGRGDAKGALHHVDLGSVAVGDDDLVVGVDGLEKPRRDLADAVELTVEAVSEGEPSERDDDSPGPTRPGGDGHAFSPPGESA